MNDVFFFVLGLVLIAAAFGIYFLPTFAAMNRGSLNYPAVLIINVFFGWTLVGWAVALALAASGNTKEGVARREAKEAADRAIHEEAIAKAVAAALAERK
jgi:hypothetical protein